MPCLTNKETLELLSTSPVGSIFYVDTSEEDGAQLQLLNLKLQSLDSLAKVIQENGPLWENLIQRYSETLGQKLAILSANITREVGDSVAPILAEPCWRIGYDDVQEKIFLHKICPIQRPNVVFQMKGDADV